jgi:hypothetical protein
MASRLLQFLSSFVKVFLNRTPDEFRNRSAGLLGQPLQPLELVFLEEQSRPLHVPILYHRHTYIHTDIAEANHTGDRLDTKRSGFGLR